MYFYCGKSLVCRLPNNSPENRNALCIVAKALDLWPDISHVWPVLRTEVE